MSEVRPDQAWKEQRAAEHGGKGNSNAAFWTLESIQRAEWSLDVWGSVNRARTEGLQSSPTITAIFTPGEPLDTHPLPFRTEGANKVKVMTRVESEKRQPRKLEDGTEAMVWLVRFTEQYIERLTKSSTEKLLSPSQVLYLTVEAWLEDIGNPMVLTGYLASLYPRRGPYEAPFASPSIEMAAGSLRLGRSSGLLEKGMGHMHKQALRDLGDWISGFGTRKGLAVPPPRRRSEGWKVLSPDKPYTVATAQEMEQGRLRA